MNSNKAITKTITINARTSKVWNCLTNPELIKVWMADTEMKIISDWTEGSAITFQTTANGKQEYKGKILQLEPEQIFTYTSYSEIFRLPDEPENYSTIEFGLTPVNDQIIVSVTHSNLVAETAMEHANFYWNSALYNIKKLSEMDLPA